MVNTYFVRLLALIVITGCAADNTEYKERASDWLRSKARTVVVRVEHEMRRPDYQVYESQTIRRAVAGGAIGLNSLPSLKGCNVPLCAPVAIVLIPAFAFGGAALGAAIAPSKVLFLPLERLEGASALSKAAFQDENLQELLRTKLIEKSPTPSGHTLVLNEPPADKEIRDAVNVANIRIYIKNYSFVGEATQNPNVSLLLDGHIVLETPGGGWFPLDWSFESPKQVISEWSANKAEIFRRQVDHFAEKIANTVIECIEDSGATL